MEYLPRLRDWRPELRPRERLQQYGAGQLPDADLLAIILRTGTQAYDVIELSRRVVQHFGDLAGVDRASFNELCQVDGLGPAKASEIKAALELGRRLVSLNPTQRAQVRSPEDIWSLVHADMSTFEQEHLRVLLLNTKNQVIDAHNVYKGTVNTTTVRMAELFTAAVRQHATSIVLVHNHPSGDPTPSPEDVRLTREAAEAGRLLEIEVLDHLVVGRGPRRYVSLKERGLGFAPAGR